MLLYTILLTVWTRPAITRASGEHYNCGVRKQGLISQQEGALWPDESHLLEGLFIDLPITETCTCQCFRHIIP